MTTDINDLIDELLEYFDDRADVDEGIPNDEMRFFVSLKAIKKEK